MIFHQAFHFLKTLWQRLNKDDAAGLSAEMAYNWMMAFIPALIFLTSIFGLINADPAIFNDLLNNLRRVMPGDAFILIQDALSGVVRSSSESLALIGLLGTLWTSSNGAIVVEKALNRAYRCTHDQRPLWLQRGVALMIVIGMGIILLICANLIVFGDMLIEAIEQAFPIEVSIRILLTLLRWLVTVGGLLLAASFIYAIAPNYPTKPFWYSTRVGASTFVVLWVSISWLFRLYVSNMAHYNAVYGTMGAIIILMFWLYLTSYVLIIGGEINALLSDCDKKAPKSP